MWLAADEIERLRVVIARIEAQTENEKPPTELPNGLPKATSILRTPM
jgi:hypothetical protein